MNKSGAIEDEKTWTLIPLTVPFARKESFKEKYKEKFVWFGESFRCWVWLCKEELPEDLKSYIHPSFIEYPPDSEPPLSIELIPRTCWFSNTRSHITPDDWKIIRDFIFYPKEHKCEICNGQGDKRRVDCHEVFHYDEINHTQKLVRLRAICPLCHSVKHFRNDGSETAKAAFDHLCRINEWTPAKAQQYIKEQFDLWHKRSQVEWSLDLSFPANHFAMTVTPESASRRRQRAGQFSLKDYWEKQTVESLLED